MRLEEELCYRAVQSRDPRFDGRFFTAVTSTGIYCRPVCPARTPLRRHVRFFSCAAAAEEAGFRPCRRCRPDTVVGSPAWVGPSVTVTRGLRCIAEGMLDDARVEDLASLLGLGERQLRRLFLQHLGASPGSVARTRRVHFARQLIDQTTLPMTEVAFASGFASLRQFNAAVKQSFGAPPSELRARRTAVETTALAAETSWLTMRLPFASPYDWDALIAFLAPRALPGVERITPEAYRRYFAWDGGVRRVEVRPVAGSSYLLLKVEPPITRGLIEVVQRARALFDCETDPWPVTEQLGQDARLGPCTRRRPGLRVPGAWDGFELAVRAILGQQVTVIGATTLAGRLVRAFGVPCDDPGADESEKGPSYLFPAAAVLAESDVARIGLPAARAEAIRALAREVASGRLSLTPSSAIEETRAQLQALPGLGPWTVEYIAMRALRDPDAFPAGDLALRRCLAERGVLPSARELSERAERWRPWRAYAAMHWWAASTRPEAKKTRRTHAHSI